METTGQLAPTPWSRRNNDYGKFWALPRIVEKWLKIHPANLEPLRGNANYGAKRRQVLPV